MEPDLSHVPEKLTRFRVEDWPETMPDYIDHDCRAPGLDEAFNAWLDAKRAWELAGGSWEALDQVCEPVGDQPFCYGCI